MKPWNYLQSLLFVVLISVGCGTTENTDTSWESLSDEQKRAPEHALSGLRVAEGLEVTLFAGEPMLVNPTNIDIDAKGRVWVCEGYNYRYTIKPQVQTKEEGDRIVILEDTDRDGVADLQKVFYQGNDINAALGICVLGNKVIVSKSPNIFVFTDEDGDDRADRKEVLFTGMAGGDHDHGAHAFVFGPDGKLYFNFGNEGKQLLDKDSMPVIDLAGNRVDNNRRPYQEGMAFRCNPDGSELEVLGWNFRNPYELAVDSYGAIWQSDNDDDGNRGTRINQLMEYGNYGFKDEKTGATWRVKRTGWSDSIPLRHWHLNDPGVVPNMLQTFAGSPTGILVYEGTLLPEVFHNQLIHTDAGPNIVRAYVVEKAGAGYKASIQNILEGNKDPWFRPSDVCVAPDGSLFVADWYDPGVGGHNMGDQGRGRIFRVAPKGKKYRPQTKEIQTIEDAITALQSPNQATRYLGWSYLEKQGTMAKAALETMSRHQNPRFQARALWLLAKIEDNATSVIEQALNDQHEDIRITGLRIGRSVKHPKLMTYLERLKNDPSPLVRREIAVALRFQKGQKASELWRDLALQYKGDRWYLEALGIGADLDADQRFATWLAAVGDDWSAGWNKDIVWRSRAIAALPKLAELIRQEETTSQTYRYFRAFDFHSGDLKNSIIEGLLDLERPDQEEIATLVLTHIEEDYALRSSKIKNVLAKVLTFTKGSSEFIELVARFNRRDQTPALLQLVQAYPEHNLGVNAVRLLLNWESPELEKSLQTKDESSVKNVLSALSRVGNDAALDQIGLVLQNEQASLFLRRAAMEAYGRSWRGENRLIRDLEKGAIDESLKGAAAAVLFTSNRQDIREAAAKYLDMPDSADGEPLPPLTDLVNIEGQAAAGALVFERSCSICHQVNGKGSAFGPDLSEIGSKLSKEGLYTAILNTNAGINFGYEGYQITLKDGNQAVGLINSRTESELELKQVGNILTTYQMSDIASIEMLDYSLMTPNLQMTMKQQELIDLISYLESLQRSAL